MGETDSRKLAIIIMGVSGSGKTTVGTLLAKELGWQFYDADDFHPPANREKMSRELRLTMKTGRAGWRHCKDYCASMRKKARLVCWLARH